MEMEQNILAAGIDTLLEMKEQVLELDGCRARVDELTVEDERLERAVSIKEKQIAEEITDTVKRRKEEVAGTFTEEEEKLRSREKKLRAKKEKFKNGKMSERIEAETAGLMEENEQLAGEAKSVFKQSHTPRICNTALYYGLFMPKNVQDFAICTVAFVLLFVAVPVGAYFLIPEPKAWYWIVIYLVAILLFGGLYVLIHNHTKSKYTETLAKGRRIRSRIRLNRKTMAKIRRQIEKDKDESVYGLDRFDQEIEEVRREMEETVERRKDALAEFENVTKEAIAEEIRSRNQDELERMKEQHGQTYQELKDTQDKVKQKTLYIAENYEALLGKEFVTATVLEHMLELMDQNKADTIGAALALYKSEGNV